MKRIITFWDHSNFQISIETLMRQDFGKLKSFDYREFAEALPIYVKYAQCYMLIAGNNMPHFAN